MTLNKSNNYLVRSIGEVSPYVIKQQCESGVVFDKHHRYLSKVPLTKYLSRLLGINRQSTEYVTTFNI